MHNRGLTAAFILSLLLLFVPAYQTHAEGISGVSAFQAGIEAFQAGKLELARRHFLAAKAGGADSQALRYNLGVTFYQLEQYSAARLEFQQLSRYPDVAPLAHYNLGLVALREQRDAEAQQAFRLVLEKAGPDKLKGLAIRQLERLNKPALPAADYGDVTLAVAVGYADNLSLLPESAASQVDDRFAEVVSTWSGYLYGDRSEGLRLEGSLYHQHFLEKGSFNQSAFHAGSYYDRALGQFVTSVGFFAGSAYLGGDFVEWHAGPALAVQGPVGQGWWKAGWRYSQIFPDEMYQPYEGNQQSFDLELRQVTGKWDWRLAYQFEYHDRADLATQSEFFNLSPRRHDIGASLSHQLTPRWWLGSRLAYRFSDYPEPYVLDGETGPQSQTRQDRRTTVSVDLNHQLSALWQVYAEWQLQDNESSLDAYEYRRHEVLLGVEFGF